MAGGGGVEVGLAGLAGAGWGGLGFRVVLQRGSGFLSMV